MRRSQDSKRRNHHLLMLLAGLDPIWRTALDGRGQRPFTLELM